MLEVPLKLRQVLPLAALVVIAIASGCSSSSSDTAPPLPQNADFDTPMQASMKPGALKANQHFANTVSVEDGQIVVPLDDSNQKQLANIQVGSIIAGNRDTVTPDLTTSKNPYGFLRKVDAITPGDGQVTLITEQASIDDWMDEGDILIGEGVPSMFNDVDPSAPATQSLHVLGGNASTTPSTSSEAGSVEGDPVTDPIKKITVRPFATVSNVNWALNPKLDGTLKIRKTFWVPTGIKQAQLLMTMDPAVSADIEVGVRVSGGGTAIGGANGYPLASMNKSWSGKSIVIPLDAGIPVTVRFEPQLQCTVSVQGSTSVKFRSELKIHAAAGFNYDGSLHDLSVPPSINPDFLHWVSGKVELDGSAECDLLMVPAVLAFDAIGLEGKVGPYVSLNAKACVQYDAITGKTTEGLAAYEQHGLTGQFDARVQVPVLSWGKSFDLVTWHGLKSKPLYFIGSAATCNVQSVDSCMGKADGFYCSQLASYSGYYCEGGSLIEGLQCDNPMLKCKSGTKTSITCQ
jgi:hypothetical protein